MNKRNGRQAIRSRRERSLERLQAQLKSGKKPEKIKGKTTSKLVELGDTDKKRIKTQIEVLEKRVVV